MFNTRDYRVYFTQLYQIELNMKRKAEKLLELIDDPIAKNKLQSIIDDEIKHIKIVQAMKDLI